MTQQMYILKGPRTIGNRFGYFGVHVPENRWVIVTDGEYTNGGFGPSSVDGKLYRTEEQARRVLETYTNNDKTGEFVG